MIALDVALEFQFGVEGKGHVGAELVHLHGVVDDQFGGEQGIDLLGVAAHPGDGVAHGREIGDGGHAGEILQQDSSRHEGNFRALFRDRLPFGQPLDILGVHEAPVFLAQQIFEQNANGEGKLVGVPDSPALEGVEAIDFVALTTGF